VKWSYVFLALIANLSSVIVALESQFWFLVVVVLQEIKAPPQVLQGLM
jgi:hypothetical protein